MKKDIHPALHLIETVCSCGQKFALQSTRPDNINLDVCSKCHPFYTGKQKLVDTSGQVEKFRRKFGRATRLQSGSVAT